MFKNSKGRVCICCSAYRLINEFIDNEFSDESAICLSCKIDQYKKKNPGRLSKYLKGLYAKRPHVKKQKVMRHDRSPQYKMLLHARRRAAKKNLDFTLVLSDIVIPAYCPVLGIHMKVGKGKVHDQSPSLDRIDNNKGYTRDNIWVISHRANTIKSSATLSELKLIVSAMERLQCLG